MGGCVSHNPQAFIRHSSSSSAFQGALDEVREEEYELQTLARATHFDIPLLRQLQQLFLRIGATKIEDGLIDEPEFAEALGLDEGTIFCRALFNEFDVLKSQKLTFRAFVVTLSKLSANAAEEEKIKFSFDTFDLNKDGYIDHEELSSLVVCILQEKQHAHEFHLTRDQIDELCSRTICDLDLDRNNKIDFEEYKRSVECRPGILSALTMDVNSLLHSKHTLKRMNTAAANSQHLKKDDYGGGSDNDSTCSVFEEEVTSIDDPQDLF